MSIKSSLNKVSNIRVIATINFFNFPYYYKKRVLACFQTRPQHCCRGRQNHDVNLHFIFENKVPQKKKKKKNYILPNLATIRYIL